MPSARRELHGRSHFLSLQSRRLVAPPSLYYRTRGSGLPAILPEEEGVLQKGHQEIPVLTPIPFHVPSPHSPDVGQRPPFLSHAPGGSWATDSIAGYRRSPFSQPSHLPNPPFALFAALCTRTHALTLPYTTSQLLRVLVRGSSCEKGSSAPAGVALRNARDAVVDAKRTAEVAFLATPRLRGVFSCSRLGAAL